MYWSYVAAAVALAGAARAQVPFPTSCSGVSNDRFQYTVDPGWEVTKVMGGLRQPRMIEFDAERHMLVLQAGMGLTAHTIGADGCVSESKTVLQNIRYNHGFSLTPDSKKLYISSETNVWEFDYDPVAMEATNQKTVVQGMSTGIHSTRTVRVVPNHPNLIVVSVGSNANFDMNAGDMRATVRVFDMESVPANGYQYNTQGHQLGWGLRNEVALAFDPNGHVWGSENSGDNFQRDGRDIHIDNPAEELNYLGDPTTENTDWYGYPQCFTVWDPASMGGGFSTGDVFAAAERGNPQRTDASCETESVPPRLSFQAHSAPIGSVFDRNGTALYITFHGSWNRQPATGYKVVEVPFQQKEDGMFEPVAAPDSMTGYKDVFGASNPGACNSVTLTRSSCFRLAGIAWDNFYSRMYVSSDNDAEGEIWVLRKKM